MSYFVKTTIDKVFTFSVNYVYVIPYFDLVNFYKLRFNSVFVNIFEFYDDILYYNYIFILEKLV